MNRNATILATALVAATLTALGGGTAQADTGQEFGHHVSTCAQTMGFHAGHNPGTHQGYAGWNGHHCH
ncbi:hypothetical protein [Actinokineospora xionganensis]|uniref:Uncharacterized protein n=1 Tax=Actinokineospora xionganensis TaxID=2684470 RepID=A0ABR7L0C5_9PSEU|nr:hypothetical protein [Actinokineospora xionganensis]MBC6445879.1 hypothetical protein [Actinokineospora xionganensis]